MGDGRSLIEQKTIKGVMQCGFVDANADILPQLRALILKGAFLYHADVG